MRKREREREGREESESCLEVHFINGLGRDREQSKWMRVEGGEQRGGVESRGARGEGENQ